VQPVFTHLMAAAAAGGRVAACVAACFWLGGCDFLTHRTEGEKLYREHCADCHGMDGSGNTAQSMGNNYANLLDNEWKFGGDDSSIKNVIRDGSFGLMPAYRDKLTEAQIQSILRHIRTLRGERAPETSP
jgi:cbb3-type cytochrome c oxidase subunit III